MDNWKGNPLQWWTSRGKEGVINGLVCTHRWHMNASLPCACPFSDATQIRRPEHAENAKSDPHLYQLLTPAPKAGADGREQTGADKSDQESGS